MNKAWLAAGIAGIIGVVTIRGCTGNRAPDEKLADHFGDICKIAHDNIGSPSRGVTKLGNFFADHTGDMLGEFGDTIVLIEKVPGDQAHDDRARLARKRIVDGFSCDQDWYEFWQAIEEDPEAADKVSRFEARYQRTIEIIFGDDNMTLRDLPARIVHHR
jgi:hypothetical protein